jgi:CMP-N-acetylneuraminic acid synthetase
VSGPVRTVAVIPARGGSKGLSRKNLRPLAGKPLIVHSIAAGLGASLVDAVYVSSEDEEIRAVAEASGARVIARPAELATDTAQNDAVTRHALQAIGAEGGQPDVLVLLQPTSPLRTARHIDECLGAYLGSTAATAMSVCAVDHHPGKCVILRDGLAEPFTNDRDIEARRQDMVPAYRQNGAIYAAGVADFLQTGRFYRKPCLAYVMHRRDSIDIDDELDLQLAELIAGARPEGNP